MIVNIESFLKEFRGVAPKELFGKMTRAILNGETELEISDEEYNNIKALHDEQEARNKALSRCARLNNEGMGYEKEGRTDDAIRCYEQNIGEGVYQAAHSYDRLMVIYRKRKDYDNEVRVIDEALKHLCPIYDALIEKYEKRKQKVISLKSRS